MNALSGKHILNIGIANKFSICYGMAQEVGAEGAEQTWVCFPDDCEGVTALSKSVPNIRRVIGCDFGKPTSVRAFLREIGDTKLDGIIQGVAWAAKKELQGRFRDTTRKNFLRCMEISVFSLILLGKPAAKLMPNGGSIIWLTYAASEATLPHYNVMGVAKGSGETSVRYMATDLGEDQIRVNAISANPVNSRAARGIRDFRYIGRHDRAKSPLGALATPQDVGRAAVFLLSDASKMITGETLHVTAGVDIVNIAPIRNSPEMAAVYSDVAKEELAKRQRQRARRSPAEV